MICLVSMRNKFGRQESMGTRLVLKPFGGQDTTWELLMDTYHLKKRKFGGQSKKHRFSAISLRKLLFSDKIMIITDQIFPNLPRHEFY